MAAVGAKRPVMRKPHLLTEGVSCELISLDLESCLGRALESRRRSRGDIVSTGTLGVRQYVMWDASSVALLKKLWASGHSAGQIAGRLGHSRDAVCAKLLRMGLKRGQRPPTAKPKIVSVPKRKLALLAACARPVHKVVSARKPAVKEFTKSQLNAMLAEAIANTARLRR